MDRRNRLRSKNTHSSVVKDSTQRFPFIITDSSTQCVNQQTRIGRSVRKGQPAPRQHLMNCQSVSHHVHVRATLELKTAKPFAQHSLPISYPLDVQAERHRPYCTVKRVSEGDNVSLCGRDKSHQPDAHI